MGTTASFLNGSNNPNGVKVADFDSIQLYELKNKVGTEVKITNYGGDGDIN